MASQEFGLPSPRPASNLGSQLPPAAFGNANMKLPQASTRGDISENVMTPMIDVVFQLLIFFVYAAALGAHELLLPADLASAGAVAAEVKSVAPEEPTQDEVWVYLTVDEQGQTRMNLNGTDYGSFAALRAVLQELAALAPESPVVLDIAGEVAAGEMIKVYDTCREAGFRAIHFNTTSGP
jgi:biopolymer transport protein ExbD